MRPHLTFILLAATLALTACNRGTAPKETAAQQARSVTVTTVAARAISGSLAASGDLAPREEAAVTPEVSGYRVIRVLVDVGDYVNKGQVLVQLDSDLLQAQLAQAQAQAAQAEDQANRVAGLDNQGVLSNEQIAQRRFQAQVARASLKDLQVRMKKMAVTAPVSGLVLSRTVRPGDQSAASGTTPWFVLARDGQIELQAQLSEGDLAKIRPGQHATVNLPSGGTAAGVVRLVSPQIDAATKLGYVRILLPVRADIRAGGFGRALFSDAAATVATVPETAIRYDADGASVMVVGGDNRVHRVGVQAGERGSGLVQLVKGPAAGTRVVANAGGLLLDGDLVRPVQAVAK